MVIPIYAVERYLEQAIDSVIEQTIGFEENIQLILVNDGSPDNSEAVCRRYQQMFPSNVTYVHQENAGVSAARNKGMEYVRGEFVNFLDGDDTWESDAFERVAAFLDAHPGIDVVAARLMYFGATTGAHPLNHRFHGDRVIDIAEEPSAPQHSVAAAFFRSSALEGRAFDMRLEISEDFRLIAPIIVDNGAYGAMESVVYNYRRREERNSAVNRASRSKGWYFDTLRLCHQELFEYSREKFGSVVPYLQHCVMHDLQWRLKARLSAELNGDETARYRDVIVSLLSDIEDEVIFAQRGLYMEHKLFALALKRGVGVEELMSGLRIERGVVYFGAKAVRDLTRQQKLIVEILEFEGDSLRIEGHINSVIEASSIRLAFEVDGENHEATLIERPERCTFSLGERINHPLGFVVVIPLKESQDVSAVLSLRDCELAPTLEFRRYARLTRAMATSYFADDGWFASLHPKLNSIRVKKDTRHTAVLRRERRYIKELIAEKRRWDLVWYRVLHLVLRPLLFGRRVWVVSDRITQARDNGEAFFRYVQAHRSRRILPYFAIAPTSPDYSHLRRVGRVVAYDSFKYKLLMLLSDAIVSSCADDYTTSPFWHDDVYMRNLYGFRFVFLQHGVSMNDMSAWLNKYRKNIKLFVTSTSAERDWILHGGYYYDESVVRLTGFPRDDSLRRGDVEVSNKIIVMPTWRKNLTAAQDRTTGQRERFPGFSDSEFFRFYNALINDSRLLAAMAVRGYSATFIPHPSMAQDGSWFQSNDLVTVKPQCDYQYEFKTAKLLVTDYSSVAFDFASLGKPVIYAQYDAEAFHQGQIYRGGHFDYAGAGFGPVCADYEETIAAIIDALDRDCEMEEPYRTRASTFFLRDEISSCEAVYQAIVEA